MLAGEAEPAAVSIALGELGDASTLAAQWSNARHRPRRRLFMGFAVGFLGVCGIAIVATVASGVGGSLAGRTEPSGVGVSVFQPAAPPATADGINVLDLRVTVRQDTTWGQFFELAGSAAKRPVVVHWAQLRSLTQGNDALDENLPLGIAFKDLTLSSALNLMNDTVNLPIDDGVQVRAIDGSLVFASAAYFDRFETLMVTYDLSSVPDIDIGGEAGTQASIVDAIQQMAFPNLWRENGGDRASLQQIGRTLLIKAPRRVHTQVEWILKHGAGLGKQQEAPAVGAVPARADRAVAGVPVLRDIPIIENLFKNGAAGVSDQTPGEAIIPLRHIDPEAFRTLLGAFFDVAKGMKECDVERVMEAKGTTFRIQASQRQTTLASMVAFLIDRPASEAVMGPAETKRMRLTNTEPTAVAAWLNNAFDVSPYLHASPLPRSVSADTADNSVIFGSTADQARAVESLVRLADDPVMWTQRAISEEAERTFGTPRVISLEHGKAQMLAPVTASRMVGVAGASGGRILVVAHERLNAVVVAGDPVLVDRAERMVRSLDRIVGLDGRPELELSALRSIAIPTQVEYLPEGVVPVKSTGLGR